MQKKVSILGAGISGIGAAILASKKDYNVFISDSGSITTKDKRTLDYFNVEWQENGHAFDKILSSNIVVKSPGIPNGIEIIDRIAEEKIDLISEIEFASRFTKAKIIAITGTNGKTTTSLITYKILKDAGYDVLLAGNIGKSFSLEISQRDYKYIVLEVSSFQLDNIIDFRPDISIILNITSDHLDRYKGAILHYSSPYFVLQLHSIHQHVSLFSEHQLILESCLNQPLFLHAHFLPPRPFEKP